MLCAFSIMDLFLVPLIVMPPSEQPKPLPEDNEDNDLRRVRRVGASGETWEDRHHSNQCTECSQAFEDGFFAFCTYVLF